MNCRREMILSCSNSRKHLLSIVVVIPLTRRRSSLYRKVFSSAAAKYQIIGNFHFEPNISIAKSIGHLSSYKFLFADEKFFPI